jgi:hypothetical protein
MSHQLLLCRLMLSFVLLTAVLTSTEAHRSGCHRWHSCPSDRGTYTCGDLGYCSQCPDNAYCQAGRPQSAARQPPPQIAPPPPSPATPPPTASPSPTQPLTARVTQIADGDTIDVELQGRRERVRYIGIDSPETKHPSRGIEPLGQRRRKPTAAWSRGRWYTSNSTSNRGINMVGYSPMSTSGR